MAAPAAHLVQRRQRRQNRDTNSLRHRIHTYAYAGVAFGLFTLGAVFSGFAIFERQSEISKIWLAGPTTIAVALVLCGKVMIDRRPPQPFPGEDGANNGEDDEETQGIINRQQQPSKEQERTSLVDVAYLQIAQKKTADLVLENFYITDPRLSKPVHQQMAAHFESQIWNLRTTTTTTALQVTSTSRTFPQIDSHFLPHSHSPRSPRSLYHPQQQSTSTGTKLLMCPPKIVIDQYDSQNEIKIDTDPETQSGTSSSTETIDSKIEIHTNADPDQTVTTTKRDRIKQKWRIPLLSNQQKNYTSTQNAHRSSSPHGSQNSRDQMTADQNKDQTQQWQKYQDTIVIDLSVVEPRSRPASCYLYQGETFLINDRPYLI